MITLLPSHQLVDSYLRLILLVSERLLSPNYHPFSAPSHVVQDYLRLAAGARLPFVYCEITSLPNEADTCLRSVCVYFTTGTGGVFLVRVSYTQVCLFTAAVHLLLANQA